MLDLFRSLSITKEHIGSKRTTMSKREDTRHTMSPLEIGLLPPSPFPPGCCLDPVGHSAVKQCSTYVGRCAVKQCFLPLGHCAVKQCFLPFWALCS